MGRNQPPPPTTLRGWLRALYFGDSPEARRFRYGLILFDFATIGLFLVTATAGEHRWMIPLDIAVACLLALDLAARFYAERDRRRFLLDVAVLADVVVILSLLLASIVENVAFLRVARSLRLLRSYHLLRDLRSESSWFRSHEQVILRTTNLFVFIFLVTSAVYVSQRYINAEIGTYVDALYFTITTLTTTGFGDITMKGSVGRLLAVVIMIVGVSLFLHLLQAIFRPPKVRQKCPDCGLLVHDADAVHCKHCGRVLYIETEGAV